MTATRDRQSDLDQPSAEPAWDERAIVGRMRGLPWWAAVLLAFGLAAAAAWVDMHRQDSLGRIYQGAYILGCLAAVCWVRRRNLFGPMVQPPLVFAVTAIGAVAMAQPGPLFSGGAKQLLLSVALPLTSNFPTMAITTGVTVAIGLLRLWLQRDPNPPVRSSRQTRERDPFDRAPFDSDERGDAAMRRSARDGAPSRSRRAARPELDEPSPGTRFGRDGDRPRRPGRDEPRDPPPRVRRGRTDVPPGDRGRTDPPSGERQRPRVGGQSADPNRRRQPPDQRRMDQPHSDTPPRRPRRQDDDY
ncbi:MAG: DUF6542 domain-containing protein [Labedaea sp.]